MKLFHVIVVTTVGFLVLLNAIPSNGLRILGIFPGNVISHFAMGERLMKGLAERGHQVDVYSHFPSKNRLTNYTDYFLENVAPLQQLNDIKYESLNKVTNSFMVYLELGKFGISVCNLLKSPILRNLIKNPPKNPPYDLVIVEPFIFNCYLALGRHLNVPLIAVSSSNLLDWVHEPMRNPFNPAVHPSFFSGFVAPMTFYERMENIVISMVATISFNHFVSEQDWLVREIFGPDYPSAQELYKDVSLMLVNYNQALNGVRPFAPSIVPVGGLHIVDGNETLSQRVQEFMDTSKHGFVFMSFGSVVNIEIFPKDKLEAFYGAFRKISPIRVLMKISNYNDLPKGLPSNVMTHHWLPHVKVLKHKNIKAFISHGGLMDTQEAIYFGVPIICIPLFPDQQFNIRSYEQKKVAVKVEVHDLTEETFIRALLEILGSPLYKKAALKMRKMLKDTPRSPMDTAVYWIEYVHRHGKNALRSSELEMSWWQIASLDVFLALSLIIVTSGVIVILVSSLLFYLCKSTIKSISRKLKRD